MEVIVSVALFSVIILSATQIFKMVVDSQRNALATQNVQESLKYFLEVTAKELRMAQRNGGGCTGIGSQEIYHLQSNALGDVLRFKNYYGQCVTYELVDSNGIARFRVTRNNQADFISPAKVRINSLDFLVTDNGSQQPLVTIRLQAEAVNDSRFKSMLDIQTSLASRYYK